jgi:hypothetical protein
VRHPKSGKVGISREEGNVTFSRSGLAQYLIDQARQAYPDSIRFHFDAACAGEGGDHRPRMMSRLEPGALRHVC